MDGRPPQHDDNPEDGHQAVALRDVRLEGHQQPLLLAEIFFISFERHALRRRGPGRAHPDVKEILAFRTVVHGQRREQRFPRRAVLALGHVLLYWYICPTFGSIII